MSETKTYTGSCHCGAVKYEVETDLAQVISCDCSMCQRSGTILTFVPMDKFKLISGEEQLQDYQFNKKIIHHLFCKVCGIKAFGKGKNKEGEDTAAVNVRCLDGVDISELKPFHYHGKDV